MKKKILGLALACTLVVSQAVVAFAAPSRTATTSGAGDTTASFVTTYTDIEDLEALSILELAVNTDATDAEIVYAVNKTGDVSIGTASFVTKFLDVSVPKSADGQYHVSLKASLPAGATTANVRILHYSVARGVWEVVAPTSIENGVVNFTLADCSPVAVYVTDATAATSPVTGVVSSTALFMGAAAVCGAVSVTAKKRK